jgi:serine/threonine protein kinase
MERIWQHLGHFQHPRLQQTLDFFEEGGLPVLVLEAIPGKSLAQICHKQPFSEAQALSIIRQVGASVETLHHRGVLHYDLKPENLIRHAQSGEIVLVDWGLLPDGAVDPTNYCYMAPEYLGAGSRLETSVDLYGLAATFYTLLVGQAPPVASLLSQTPLGLPPTLNPLIRQAILQGMELDSLLRPPSVTAWLALSSIPKSQAPRSPQPVPVTQPKSLTQTPHLPISAKIVTKSKGVSPRPLPPPRPVSLAPSPPFTRHPLKFLAVTGLISTVFGLSFGLVLRFNDRSGLPGSGLLHPDQTFPEQAWPGSLFPEMPDSAPAPEQAGSDGQTAPLSDFTANDYGNGEVHTEPEQEPVIPANNDDFAVTIEPTAAPEAPTTETLEPSATGSEAAAPIVPAELQDSLPEATNLPEAAPDPEPEPAAPQTPSDSSEQGYVPSPQLNDAL